MIYRAIGVCTLSSNTIIAFAEFHENAGEWTYDLKASSVLAGDNIQMGKLINEFIADNNLQYQVALVSVYHDAKNRPQGGAVIAAETALPVITSFSEMDIALGGNGEFFSFMAAKLKINSEKPDETNKAICVALMGVLRWREEFNFLSSHTGASRSSIGGAVWIGDQA